MMSEVVWPEKSIKPDRTGVWAYKDESGKTRVVSILDEDEWQATWPGKWVRIGDLPTIVDPPKYRQVRMGDERQEILVCGSPAFMIGFSRSGDCVIYERNSAVRSSLLEHCLILDDGQPKREPREWWCNVHSGSLAHSRKTKNEVERFGLSEAEVIHVREVIDEPTKA